MTSQDETDSPIGREALIDAAVRLFGRDGFDATSVRAIADEAGVSWGLVRFYFGSKDGLREAADARVIKDYIDRVAAAAHTKTPDELNTLIETQNEGLSQVARYLRRAIMEERPMALEFLRRLLAAEQANLAQARTRAPRNSALSDPLRRMVIRVGYLLLAPQIETLTGRDVFSVRELKRRNVQEQRLDELILRGLRSSRKD